MDLAGLELILEHGYGRAAMHETGSGQTGHFKGLGVASLFWEG